MDTISLWESLSKDSISYPTLSENIEVDIAIIGGGITGITTALNLNGCGKKIAIIEANKISSGTTGFSTGNLYVPVQPYYQTIVSKFNLERAKEVALARQYAIDYIEKIVKEKNISCNFFRRPWFLHTADDDKILFLEKEVDTFKQMGFDIDYTNELPLKTKFIKAAILNDQARFNPVSYVTALAKKLHSDNCQIFENTRITSVKEKKGMCYLTTPHAKIIAKKVVIATHTPIGINLTQSFTAPYRSYVVSVQLKEDDYPDGNFWDLSSPHHAVSTHPLDGTKPALLMAAGSHHKTGQGHDMNSHFQELENYLRDNFPVSKVAFRWSAQHYHPADAIPYIGLADRFAKNTYMATGFYADGLVYGTLAGIILGDVLLEKNNHFFETFNSNRFTPLASSRFLLKENSNLFLQYLKDYPLFKSDDYKELKKNEGKIVEIDREKWAVCRDDNNQLHMVSAVCTHMKGIVNWNNAESTWDCPCHGSRFTLDGKVIEGPAVMDLKKKK